MAAKLRVDLEKCIKAGECYYNHPTLFKVGKDGFPIVLIETLDTDALKEEGQAAADVCPAAAIIYED